MHTHHTVRLSCICWMTKLWIKKCLHFRTKRSVQISSSVKRIDMKEFSPQIKLLRVRFLSSSLQMCLARTTTAIVYSLDRLHNSEKTILKLLISCIFFDLLIVDGQINRNTFLYFQSNLLPKLIITHVDLHVKT